MDGWNYFRSSVKGCCATEKELGSMVKNGGKTLVTFKPEKENLVKVKGGREQGSPRGSKE